jgi:hypothetical protein
MLHFQEFCEPVDIKLLRLKPAAVRHWQTLQIGFLVLFLLLGEPVAKHLPPHHWIIFSIFGGKLAYFI